MMVAVHCSKRCDILPRYSVRYKQVLLSCVHETHGFVNGQVTIEAAATYMYYSMYSGSEERRPLIHLPLARISWGFQNQTAGICSVDSADTNKPNLTYKATPANFRMVSSFFMHVYCESEWQFPLVTCTFQLPQVLSREERRREEQSC